MVSRIPRALVTFLLVASSTCVPARAQRVLPRDEAAHDPGFQVFRDGLLEALHQRDRNYLVGILSPKIQSSFGGAGGIEEFLATWNLDHPQCRLWDELGRVLSMGGQFKRESGTRSFYAPFTFTATLPEGFDPYETMIVTSPFLPLFAEPRSDAPRVAWLSRNILRVVRVPSQLIRVGDFTHVETSDGRRGFAPSVALRSPIDYRACFQQVEGRWMLTAFVSGD